MKLFSSTDFDYHYPVGHVIVAVAKDEDEARTIMGKELVSRGITPYANMELTEHSLIEPSVVTCLDGEY